MEKIKIFRFIFLLNFVVIFMLSGNIYGQNADDIIDKTVNNLKWRSIGPANMAGRIDDFAVVESNPFIIYVGTASGGIWKTTNNGVTWKPVFDDQATSTIGNIDVAPSNPEVLWVGTGEANNRQSSSWGNGVYKSTDGGNTWHHMGLDNTHHIGRVRIDPKNPDVVYIAAAGHLWGPNEERGVYKTADGGKTWEKVLYIDENTGCIDLAVDHENNNIVYAAMYQRMRKGYGFIGGGPGSGLYKTVDAGETWKKLTEGLPKGETGRIGIDIFRSDPNIVYAVFEHKEGGIFRSEDKGETWTKMSDINPRPMYYSKIRIDPNNDRRIWVLGARMYTSYDGGKTFNTRVVQRIHSDHHAMWINPANSNHMIVGSDGGIYFSYDKGLTWDYVCTIPLGQFYEVDFDMQRPYNIYGGLQDNGSWGGPSATKYSDGITNADWFRVGGGDGFYTKADPKNPDILYVESQNGYLSRMNLLTKESKSIRPTPDDPKERYRFNWNSPLLISPHNSKTIYYGGNKLFKSTDMGDTWTASIDLTTQQERDELPIMGIVPDSNTLSAHDGISFYGDIITISESPITQGILWIGTDDGNIQLSRDGGKTWENLIKKIKEVPEYTYVSRVVASAHVESRAYVTLDGHRNDDFKPYVFVTEDFGKKWKNISNGIPVGSTVNVIREHPENPNLLFIGTERGAYFSINRGETWYMFKSNLPMVPVDDIAVHPRDNDLIFGTHGRSIWVLDDITPLEQLTKDMLESDSYLFSIRPAERFQYYNRSGSTGHKIFTGANPQFGALITYYLKEELGRRDRLSITVYDKEGKQVRRLRGTKNKGFNRVVWNLRYQSARQLPQGAPAFRRFMPSGPYVIPGEYTIKLNVAGNEISTPVTVDLDPRYSVSEEDLIAQRDAALRLEDMNGKVSRMNTKLRTVQTQLSSLTEYLKNSGNLKGDVKTAVDDFKQDVDEVNLKLNGSRRRRDMTAVSREIMSLSRTISGYTARPTIREMKLLEKIPAMIEEVQHMFDNLIKEKVPAFNKNLSELNVPLINPNAPPQRRNFQRRRF